jgi:hypothetical protein
VTVNEGLFSRMRTLTRVVWTTLASAHTHFILCKYNVQYYQTSRHDSVVSNLYCVSTVWDPTRERTRLAEYYSASVMMLFVCGHEKKEKMMIMMMKTEKKEKKRKRRRESHVQQQQQQHSHYWWGY